MRGLTFVAKATTSTTAQDVIDALKTTIAVRALPFAMSLDNGPEFIADALAGYNEFPPGPTNEGISLGRMKPPLPRSES